MHIEFGSVYDASKAISCLAYGAAFLHIKEGKDSGPDDMISESDMEMYIGLSVTYVPDPSVTPSSAGIREYGIRRLGSHEYGSSASASQDKDHIHQGADWTPHTSENSIQKYQLLQRRDDAMDGANMSPLLRPSQKKIRAYLREFVRAKER